MTQAGKETTGESGRKTFIRRNGIHVECHFAENGRLQKKFEWRNGRATEFTYRFDGRGHLLKVSRDGMFAEEYTYSESGQRIEQRREYRGWSDFTDGPLYYDSGRLERAGSTHFEYDGNGALAARCNSQGITRYTYGKDSLLETVLLPSRVKLRYECERNNPFSPVRRFKNDKLSCEYEWLDPLRLSRYLDHEHQLAYSFIYGQSGLPDKVRIAPMFQGQVPTKDWWADSTDWLGALVERERTERLHELLRNSGGSVGRFTAPDPLGDTGGDHDLYDYCVDDPVTLNDPTGLFPLLPFLAIGALGTALGLGGAFSSAKLVDWFRSKRDGKQSTAAQDAVKGVAPKVVGISAVSSLPGVGMMAPGAGAAAAQRVGAAVQSSRYADKIVTGVTHAAQFAEPFVVPGPPTAISIPGFVGAAGDALLKQYREREQTK